MKTTTLILALLAPCFPLADVGCIGSESMDCRWEAIDYTLQASTVGLLLFDWMQTRRFTKGGRPSIIRTDRTWRFEGGATTTETNPLLGRYPSKGRLAAYFLSCMVGHTAVSMLLPKPYRPIWQGVWIGLESGYVAHNMHVVGGVRLSIPW